MGRELKRGDRVRYSNGVAYDPGTGIVAKVHPKAGRDGLGSVEIYPDGSDGRSRKLCRKVRHVQRV